MDPQPSSLRWQTAFAVILSLLFVIGETGWAFLKPTFIGLTYNQYNIDWSWNPMPPVEANPVWVIPHTDFSPRGLTTDRSMSFLYAGSQSGEIFVIDIDGNAEPYATLEQSIFDIEMISTDTLLVTSFDEDGDRLSVYPPGGQIRGFSQAVIEDDLFSRSNPASIAAQDGTIYALDVNRNRFGNVTPPLLFQFDVNGNLLNEIKLPISVRQPARIEIGTMKEVIVPITNHQSLYLISADGRSTNLNLDVQPMAVAVDEVTYDFYILEASALAPTIMVTDLYGLPRRRISIPVTGSPRDIEIFNNLVVVATSSGLYAIDLSQFDE